MEGLVQNLVDRGVLTTKPIIEAFRAVDRKDFVSTNCDTSAYQDIPLKIGHGQTISQPYTVAFMLELLQPKVGDVVLDIGSGSGWTTALLASIVGKNGKVFGLERVPKLIEFGRDNLKKYSFPQASINEAQEGVLGYPDKKFDKILVSASANKFPVELKEQLNMGGRIVVPVRHAIVLVEKSSDMNYRKVQYPGFAFVPLIHS